MAVASAVAVLGSLAVLAGTSAAAGNSVTIKGTSYHYSYRFSPKTLTIKAGKKVTWSWSSDDHHNVTFKSWAASTRRQSQRHRLQDDVQERRAPSSTMCTHHGFTGKIVVVKPKP